MRYRKKPVVIEAVKWDGTQIARDKLLRWGGFHLEDYNNFGELEITTLEGVMKAEIGDWIIKGVKGEFYPCKPDIFKATYEEVQS